MSKKTRIPRKPEVEKEADYYKLKTDAVQALIEANEENSPEVSKEELRKYQSHRKLRVADWVKLLLIKWWFPGSCCFFILWGLGTYLVDMLDTLFVIGIVMGMVTDLLTNNTLRFFEKEKGEANRWIMVTKRGFVSFPLNILYAFAVLALVVLLYEGVNRLFEAVTGQTDVVFLGVEPIFFGLFWLGADLLLICLKNLLVSRFRKPTEKQV